jgi:Trypsin-co-occurring domain 1
MKSTKLITLKGPNATILVEAVRTDDTGIEPAAADRIGKAIDNTVDAAVSKITDTASSFAALTLPKEVTEAVVEMGFQFDAKGSIYLVSSTATASIKLTLKLTFKN